MDVTLRLRVEDPADVDEAHDAGLTEEATNRLIDAVADAGFGIVAGPHQWPRP